MHLFLEIVITDVYVWYKRDIKVDKAFPWKTTMALFNGKPVNVVIYDSKQSVSERQVMTGIINHVIQKTEGKEWAML